MNKTIKINSKIENLHIVEQLIDDLTNDLKINKDCYGNIMVSTLEAVNNAIVHGNEENEAKYVYIDITYQTNKLIISVRDEGDGFIPEKIPDPTLPENIENANGRGVFLMKKLTDLIEFNDKGNEVIMSFIGVNSDIS